MLLWVVLDMDALGKWHGAAGHGPCLATCLYVRMAVMEDAPCHSPYAGAAARAL